VLPYCCDPRHAPDTLFFVAEEDFRLFEHEERADAQLFAEATIRAMEEQSGEPFAPEVMAETASLTTSVDVDEIYRQRVAETPLRGEEAASAHGGQPSMPGWIQHLGGFYRRAQKPTAAEMRDVSPRLSDLVKLCTAAHRCKPHARGHLVWLGWDASTQKGRRTKVSHASTLIALSQHGAKVLTAAFQRRDFAFGHFDLCLLKWLQEGDNQLQLGASYVYPCVGHYKGHVSGCSPIGFRNPRWKEGWVQQGTRKDPSIGANRHRWLMAWKESGTDWLHEVCIPEPIEGPRDLRWKTLRPPPEEEDVQQGKKGGKDKRVLQRPAAVVQELGQTIAVDLEGFEPGSLRAKRVRRNNLLHYAFRFFVDDAEEANACSFVIKRVLFHFLLRVFFFVLAL
jgi:hypothetical protein